LYEQTNIKKRMIIGVPKEIKTLENRVALVPAGVEKLVEQGHHILIEKSAGEASGFSDNAYQKAGAEITKTAEEIFARAEMIVKVKEPLPEEYAQIRDGQLVFTFFHFASSEELTRGIQNSNSIAIAYETIEKANGSLPILTPMSEVAGRLAVQSGALYLHKENKGRGLLLGGIPGVEPGTVVVLGAGAVGVNAAKMAAGLGAKVYLLDISMERLRYLSDIMPANVITMASNPHNIRELIQNADLVVSGVLIPGAKAPKLITREMLRTMKKGSVIIDVCIDQGGSLETSRPTSHDKPVFIEEGVIHYCVTNMPGSVPITSTIALTNVTLSYISKIANGGIPLLKEDPELSKGVNIAFGRITHKAVAEAFNLPYTPLKEALNGSPEKVC